MSDTPAAPATGAAGRPVLVLYAPENEPFVRGFLLPALGPSAHGEPVIDARDVAKVKTAELDAALLAGGVAIAVFTPAFLNNPWARESESLASDAAVDGRLELIPLMLEACAVPPHIAFRMAVDFTQGNWEGLASKLRTYLARPVPVEAPLACPYPGMRPFEAADAKYFFGRSDEITAVVGLVSGGEREVYLIGPSGSGKSSLMAAGVLPRLAAQSGAGALVERTMRPGDAPLARLAECLDAAPAAAVDAAAVAAWSTRHPGARLLVFVDQLEELFGQGSRGDQDRFAAALAVLRGAPPCMVVLALRADFYGELMQSALWRDGLRHVDLPPLRGDALRAAIEQPARALEVYLEPALIERLVADAAGEPGMLPLLQETLVQLWSRRSRQLLTLAAYEGLGQGGRSGLAVAISSRADRCIAELAPDQVAIARRLLLRLVSFGEGRPSTRRRQTRTQLAAGEAAAAFDPVLQRLVAARLVTMDGDGGSAQVDLCHEVLITAWPAFAGWVDSYRADEQRRRKLQTSAEDWIARGRGDSGLLDDGELAAATAWRRSDAARALGESPEVAALIDASRTALTRARWLWRGRVAGIAGLLALVAVVGWIAKRRADDAAVQHGAALRTLGEQYREVGRQEVLGGHFQRAIPYLVSARRLGIDDSGVRMLFHTATRSSVVTSLRHNGPVAAASFSPDSRRIVTASADGTARVWDAASGAEVLPALAHPTRVVHAAFSPDGRQILTIGEDNTARIWSATSASPPIALEHAGPINTASFSPDGAVVITASDDRIARLWDARSGAPLRSLVHGDRVLSAQINRDGSRVVTMVADGLTAALWDTRTGVSIAALREEYYTTQAHFDLVTTAAFSPDGTRMLTTSYDSTALVWNAVTGKPVVPPIRHGDGVHPMDAAWSPDGTRVVTADDQGRVRIWNASSGEPADPPIDSTRAVRVSYSGDGARILASCDDKVVRIWDSASGSLVAAFELEAGMMDAAISPDGQRVVTASFDGVARIWSLGSAGPRVVETGAHIRDAAYSPDGARIATTDNVGNLHLWPTAGGPAMKLHAALGAITVVFDRDGGRFAAVGINGGVEIGDTASGAMHVFHRERGRNPSGGFQPDVIIGNMPARGGFSPDGTRFAALAGDQAARIWDVSSGEPVTPPLVHDAAVWTVHYSPRGDRVVTASNDGTARIWNATTGAPIGAPLVHPAGTWVTQAVFSPDGHRIATVCTDNKVRLWDEGANQPRAVLAGHSGWIIAAVFSPDGTRLLTHSDDRSARLWDVATGALAVPPLEHHSQVTGAGFSPDGTRIATASDQLVQVWDATTGKLLGPPFIHLAGVRDAVFSPDGKALVTAARDGIRVWDVEVDARPLADWQRVAANSSFPQLGEAMAHMSATP